MSYEPAFDTILKVLRDVMTEHPHFVADVEELITEVKADIAHMPTSLDDPEWLS